MKGWVIDSSIGFAWVHPGQASGETDELLTEVEGGALGVVPVLWFAEMANGLLMLQRRKKITAGDRKVATELLRNLSLEVDEEAGRAAFGATADLAEKYGLTVYDATYLEVALRRKLRLATRDEALKKAAKACGVEIF